LNAKGPLEGYRIVDVCDSRGALAGAVFAQLGAEVLLVEPPEGSTMRREPPFLSDQPGDARSLAYWAFNRGKRSVIVDLATPEGGQAFHRLLETADVLLTSGSPSDHLRLGLGSLEEIGSTHPSLVIGNVSGFGLTGPKANWADSDLICAAAGLAMSLRGDADRPPLRIGVPQVYQHAALDVVVGALLSLLERRASGIGQIVDSSAQESWIWEAGYNAYLAEWGRRPMVRHGETATNGRNTVRFNYPASDGSVSITVLIGAAVGPYTDRLVRWMEQEGECPPEIAAVNWGSAELSVVLGLFPDLQKAIAQFTSRRTRDVLFAGARERRLLVAPVLGLDDVLEAEQFKARDTWREMEMPDGRRARVPGPFAKFAPVPLPEIGGPPPLGSGVTESADRSGRPPSVEPGQLGTKEPLGGVKVLDLSVSFAGPLIGRTLAAFGARVIKVESSHRPDTGRAAGPFNGKCAECSMAFAHTNAGKWSLALDFSKPNGQEVLYDLVRWADVIVDAFTPGALARRGLSDQRIRSLNSAAVVVHTSMLGQTGPLSGIPGYGNMAVALTGFYETTGWPDRRPVGPADAYTDWLAPRFGVIAALAALDQRQRGGEAHYVDLGQGEAALQLLSTCLLDRQLNGRNWVRMGNRDHFMAPHSVFPTSGDDQWIAIACRNDSEWRELAGLLARPDISDMSLAERLEAQDDLEKVIAAWTAPLDGARAEELLQLAGIPAHRVQNSADCAADPQLAHRGGWMSEVVHAEMGTVKVGLPPFKLSRSSASLRTAGPTLGEHTEQVLKDILGYDDERITQLAIAEILE